LVSFPIFTNGNFLFIAKWSDGLKKIFSLANDPLYRPIYIRALLQAKLYMYLLERLN